MNQNFYNGKFTIITKNKLVEWNILKNFDLWYGPIEEVVFKIKKFELDNDVFYNGHVIINNLSILKELKLKYINKLDLTENCVYVENVHHGEKPQECKIQDDVIICNSFNLPIIGNNSRTQNNLYSDLWSHRTIIKKLRKTPLL